MGAAVVFSGEGSEPNTLLAEMDSDIGTLNKSFGAVSTFECPDGAAISTAATRRNMATAEAGRR